MYVLVTRGNELRLQKNRATYNLGKVNLTEGLKYLKMSTTHREDDGGVEGPERGTEARSAGVPRG